MKSLLSKEVNQNRTGSLEPVFKKLFEGILKKTLDKTPRYNKELLQQNNSTIALESSLSDYPSISKPLLKKPFLEHNIKHESNYKNARKKNHELMALKKLLKLPHGKSCYYCGSPKTSSPIALDCDNNGNSRINGLNHCSSIYQCNFCQQRILPERQKELEIINKHHLLTGGGICLVTLTVKHDKYDSFDSLLGSATTKTGILGAYSYLISKDRGFKKLLEKYNIQMSCRVFETTWGKINGFHAHIHSLFYMQKKLSTEELNNFREEFYTLWLKSVSKVGLKLPNNKNGIDIQDGSKAGSYLAKWSMSSELTGVLDKKAKNGNYNINQLEELLLSNDETNISTNQVKKVLKEYYKGCFGKRFLTWSDKTHLRNKYLAIENAIEKSDSDILETSDIESKKRIVMGVDTFKPIYSKNKVHNLRCSFELGSFDVVLKLLKSLSISTHDIHLEYDLNITEEEKLQKLNHIKMKGYFFPEHFDNLERLNYFILNYENLMETALDYYSDNSSLSNTNAFYPYVIDFCKQYENRLFLDNSF